MLLALAERGVIDLLFSESTNVSDEPRLEITEQSEPMAYLLDSMSGERGDTFLALKASARAGSGGHPSERWISKDSVHLNRVTGENVVVLCEMTARDQSLAAFCPHVTWAEGWR
eukprot:764091-Hanusia_phi.AAC.21